MPGIVGYISCRQEANCPVPLEEMIKSMVHERTYRSGSITVEQLGVSAGWVTLADSFADCLPIWNKSKDVCLLFAGENFADPADLDRSGKRGNESDSCKAGYLVQLYENLGSRFFEQLNGVFSGLLIDLRERRTVLFTDRYGLGRVYCHETPEGVYFASEAKALLKALPQLRQLDVRGLAEQFACGCVLQNRTLFSKISVLPAGAAWTFCPGESPKKRHFFDTKSWESQPTLPESEYYERLKQVFTGVLPRYFRSRQKISMSLTGGLDSRMIMAWADLPPSTLPCYSHRGMFRECADARVARRVATVCGQSHRTLTVDGEFMRQFPVLAERAVYLTDGCMDVSGAASLYVNRIARDEIAPVRMTGNYGGEVLRGVVMLGPAKLRNPFLTSEFMSKVNEGRATLAAERQCRRTSLIISKQVPWHHHSRFKLESSQLTIRSPYLDNELVSLAFQAPTDISTNQRLAARLITDGKPELAQFPTDRGPLGRSGMLGRISERYQEFTFKADYAYDYGMPHWLARTDRLLSPLHLERLFLGRHKYYHFRYFYRTQLAPFVKEVLLDPRALSRPYLDRRQVEQMVLDHTAGRGNYTSEIHVLLTSELTQRQLIECS